MKIFLHWLFSAIAIGVAAYLVPGVSMTVGGALVGAVVLGALNMLIKPLILVLTLPINIVTLGLFTLVINAFLVWLASLVVPGFAIVSFWSAFFFAFVLVIVNGVFNLWQHD